MIRSGGTVQYERTETHVCGGDCGPDAGCGAAGVRADPDVFGLHARYTGQAGEAGYAVQGEYYDGGLLDGGMLWDADGWYGQVAYTPANSLTTVLYRYGEFEATFDGVRVTQEASYSTENYERHTLGVAGHPSHPRLSVSRSAVHTPAKKE